MWRDAASRLEFVETEKMNTYILQVMSILSSPKYLYFLLPGQEVPAGSRWHSPERGAYQGCCRIHKAMGNRCGRARGSSGAPPASTGIRCHIFKLPTVCIYPSSVRCAAITCEDTTGQSSAQCPEQGSSLVLGVGVLEPIFGRRRVQQRPATFWISKGGSRKTSRSLHSSVTSARGSEALTFGRK